MKFDPENKIIKLCSEGILLEGKGQLEDAAVVYDKAWKNSSSTFEKSISAHYVARVQKTVEEKLKWDLISLEFALKVEGDEINGVFPSLYLNIGKSYEDLFVTDLALKNYELALSYSNYLPKDSYGKMILSGIEAGIRRVKDGIS